MQSSDYLGLTEKCVLLKLKYATATGILGTCQKNQHKNYTYTKNMKYKSTTMFNPCSLYLWGGMEQFRTEWNDFKLQQLLEKNEIELQQLLEKNDFKKTTILTEEPFKENMGHSKL